MFRNGEVAPASRMTSCAALSSWIRLTPTAALSRAAARHRATTRPASRIASSASSFLISTMSRRAPPESDVLRLAAWPAVWLAGRPAGLARGWRAADFVAEKRAPTAWPHRAPAR